jgi:hypothetical protein
MNSAAFLQRALSARAVSTVYMLGKGGWTRAEQAAGKRPAQAGRSVDLPRELALMRTQRPKVHADYLATLSKAGLTLESLPALACDCSGFVCWALDVARDSAPWPGGWINTDRMVGDARGQRRLFRPAERAAPGMMLVYPKPPAKARAVPPGGGDDGPPGHVGIITAVSADGRPTRVLHCSPTNYLLPPPAGLPHNAIAETGPEPFYDIDPRSLVVAWRAFDA